MTVIPEVTLLGISLGPVATILIAEAVLFFLLMNFDAVAGRFIKPKLINSAYNKYFLFWVFMIFALFSAAPLLFGIDTGNLAIMLGTVMLFGLFITGFGISNIKRNALILMTAVLGSIVGYQFASVFLLPNI